MKSGAYLFAPTLSFFAAPLMTPRTSSSFMMRKSSPSSLISVPEYLPNKMQSPSLTARGKGRRRTGGNREQEQPPAFSGACPASTSSLARAHALSLGRRLDFCQSALWWQNSVHLPDPFPASHPSRNGENLWNQEQQRSTDWMAHTTPLACDIASLKRGECESRAIAASSHNPKDYPGALRASGFSRSTGSSQEGRTDGPSREIPGEVEGEKCHCDGVRSRFSFVLGVRGCPESILPKSAKCCEILVSAAGLEPATHALKGHCSTN